MINLTPLPQAPKAFERVTSGYRDCPAERYWLERAAAQLGPIPWVVVQEKPGARLTLWRTSIGFAKMIDEPDAEETETATTEG